MPQCNRKQVAIILVAAALIAGFFGGVYIPLTREMSALRAEQRRYSMEAAQMSADTSRLPVLSDQLREMQVRVGDFEARIPRKQQLGEFLQAVTKIMNERNLQDQLVQPGQAVRSRGLISIPVVIHCQGNLQQIFGFLRSIEQLDRLVRFENVELSTDRTFSGSASLHSRLYIYYRDSSEAEI